MKEARGARAEGDYAIGAVIVRGNEVIASSGSRACIDNDSTQHAEIVAIQLASKKLQSRHLRDCVLYTTHEPCPMCAAAAVWSILDGIVSATTLLDMVDYAKQHGNGRYSWRTIDVSAKDILMKVDPRLWIVEGFMREECMELFHS